MGETVKEATSQSLTKQLSEFVSWRIQWLRSSQSNARKSAKRRWKNTGGVAGALGNIISKFSEGIK